MERRTFFQLGLTGVGAMAVVNEAWAMKYYPNPSDKKWAVLYGTWCGTARDAGVWISEGMGGIADVFDVRENPDLSGFDHVVVGGAIRMGEVSPQLQEYLQTNQGWIKEKVRGLYTVCGNMQQPVTSEVVEQQIDNHLAPLCGVENVVSNVFLGRVTASLLEPEVREMMSQFEDYDNLKRSDCMALGKEILNSVEQAQ